MIPISLTIEGIYSYQQRAFIDFEALTASGLFGIFGSVGSGKSAILEAIGFVLYETSERLDAKDKRGYNMLNLKSNTALIDFQFYNFEQKKYRFTASWKRKKKFHEVESLVRNAYIWQDEQWLPLESNNAMPIIGLSYDNFKRTTIIPQGKFKEFLELKGKDRSNMMKEIFGLHQFDLSQKAGHLLTATNAQMNELLGKYSVFESVSDEEVTQIENNIATLNTAIVEITSTVFSQEKALVSTQQQYDNLLAYRSVQSAWEKNKEQALTIANKKINLQTYILAQQLFANDIQSLYLFNEQKKINIEKSNQTQHALTNAIEIYNKTQENYAYVQLLHAENDNRTNLAKQLSAIIKTQQTTALLNNAMTGFEKGEALCNEISKTILELKAENVHLTEKKATLQQDKIPTQTLLHIQDCLQTYKHFGIELNNKQQSLTQLSSQIEETTAKLLFNKETDWQSAIEKEILLSSELLTTAKEELNEALLKEHLIAAAASLKEGLACPLCGSTHHPQALQTITVSSDTILTHISNLENNIHTLNKANYERQNITSQLKEVRIVQQSLSEEIAYLQEKKEKLLQENLAIQNYFIQPSVFETLKHKQSVLEQDILILDNNIAKQQQAIIDQQNTLQKYKDRLLVLEIEIAQWQKQLEIEQASCEVAVRQKYTNYNEAQLNTEKDALLQTNVDAVRRLEEVNNSLEKAKSNLQSLENQHAFLLNEYQEIDKHILTIQQNIEQNLIQTSFKDITSIQTCLQQNINITQASNTIQAHETESQVLEQQLAQFDDSIATLTIDIAEIDRLKNNIKESKLTLSKTEQMRAVQVNKKEQLLEQIAIKEAISKQIAVITNRSQNLQVLKNLFNGAGFVNYISTIYLKKLCDLANKRFHRLTKNQLSLSINELNDFEIIDYLNNGYSRSVKTLSGGQLFQASLCLALSLAENVKSMFTSSKNFFFIDEGFGTLDADSLEIVIETLQNLKKENRIVGVISHVEALKESMPQYITIEKDLQLGSIIQYE